MSLTNGTFTTTESVNFLNTFNQCLQQPPGLDESQESQSKPRLDKLEEAEDEEQHLTELNAFQGEIENQTNLIVNYLPQTLNQEEMRTLFAKIGKLTSCKLIKDKLTDQSLGYGFVNYVSSEDAQRAIQTLNRMRLHNKTIKVSLARPSCESIKGANLYICGLPKSIDEAKLEQLFSSCGKIITSRILTDSATGQTKGVGFIRFDQKFEAELAIQKWNGQRLSYCDQTGQLVVKFAKMPTSSSCTSAPTNAKLQLVKPNVLNADWSQLIEWNKLQTAELLQNDLNYNLALNGFIQSGQLGNQETKLNRRCGGPLHTTDLRRFRYNPLDACAIPIRLNLFDNLNTNNSINGITSSPANANGLRLLTKLSNLNASPNLATSLAPPYQHQSSILSSQLLNQLNGLQHVQTNSNLGIPWINPNSDPTNIQSLRSFYQQPVLKNTINDLIVLNQQHQQLPHTATVPTALGQPQQQLSPTSLNLLNNSNYYNTIDKINNLDILNLTSPTKNSCLFTPSVNNSAQLQPFVLNNSQSAPTISNENYSFLSNSINANSQNTPLNYPISFIPLMTDNANKSDVNDLKNLNGDESNTPSILRIDGLAPNTDESIIWQLFSAFPSVLSIQIIPDPDQNNAKAMVTMLDSKQANFAVHYLNGCTLQNRIIKISVETMY